MKTIKNNGDIKSLVLGDQYIIDYGIDYNDPININYNRIDQIQSAIEKEFDSTKEKTKKDRK
jgi:hypothetical protein